MNDDSSSQVPWNEAQWERFLQQADARTARYGEILETVRDDPNQDEIIAHEMGWNRQAGEFEPPERFIDRECDDEVPEIFVQMEDLNNIVDDTLAEMEHEAAEQDAQLQRIPAFRESTTWSVRIIELLRTLPSAEAIEEEVDGACRCYAVAAKIAAGHGMGYEDEVLCGNIVNCRRALQAANETLEALTRLCELCPAHQPQLAELIRVGHRTRGLIDEHIADLRSRVWWD